MWFKQLKCSRIEMISGTAGSRKSKVGHWILDLSFIFWFFFPLMGSILGQIPHGAEPSSCGLISFQFQVYQREKETGLVEVQV